MYLTGYLLSQGLWCPEVEVCHSNNDVEESGLYVEEGEEEEEWGGGGLNRTYSLVLRKWNWCFINRPTEACDLTKYI